MKWLIKYAVEREIEVDAENINEVFDIAEEGRKKEEKIVSVRSI